VRLAHHLEIHFESIQIITGIVGVLVLLVVLCLLPKSIVITFLISGLVGGIAGYYLWLIKFGQYIMP
jgi:FtsH-binding integral membrane protein